MAGQTGEHCYGNIVSYLCFFMFPRVGKLENIVLRRKFFYSFALFAIVVKLGNIFVRNIVSYQCFFISPSVDKLRNIVKNIVSHQFFSRVLKIGQTSKKRES